MLSYLEGIQNFPAYCYNARDSSRVFIDTFCISCRIHDLNYLKQSIKSLFRFFICGGGRPLCDFRYPNPYLKMNIVISSVLTFNP